jgi:hypothetical protein
MDFIRMEEGGNDNMDDSWDAVFYTDGRVDETGYVVEMAIPFKSIRFPDQERKTWGVFVGRTIARTGEIIMWPPMSMQKPGLLTQASQLVIPTVVEKGKNFEFMPVATSLKTKGNNLTFNPGLNFKWGISSDTTLDLTANPDFSHIEADAPQIDVNQRFALYYPEKRPFFLEGMEIFRFPEFNMIYTRRIIDPIGGAKLTGKTGRFTYGFLSAVDTSPTESLWDVHNGNGGEKDHNALFNIFRIKTDVFRESYVGFCLADKEINGSYNRVAGLDGQLKFGDHWFFSFQAMGAKSRYEGETTEIAPATYADFSYSSKYFSGGTYWISMHPDFIASSGYINRVDYRAYGGYVHFTAFPNKKWLSRVSLNLSVGERFGYMDSTRQDQWLRTNLTFRINEFSQVGVQYRNQMERFGGQDFRRESFSLDGQILSIGWLPFGFYFETGESIWYDEDDPYLGYSNVYGIAVTFKPSRRLRIGVDYTKQTFWEDKWGGEQVYDYNVVRTRTTYQLSKTLSLRAIVDYNHFYDEIYGSFLFSYVLRPGTVFFFGVDNNLLRGAGGGFASDHYSVFIKFSYWHRL